MPYNQTGQHARAEFNGPYNDTTYNYTTYNNSALSIDLVARLNPVLKAAYDCGPRADYKCYEGTRVEVVQKIDEWAYLPVGRPLCLLDGPAGFGKSAIARTVAHRWDHSKLLAGTFFFFRNSGDQSKAIRLIPTLSYQLTHSIPETKQSIESALLEDPSLLNRSLEQQFQKLIIDPVVALPEQSRRSMLIVIDALDECDDRDYIPKLIEFITSIDRSKFPIDFLFTSRREEYIRKIFETSTVNHMIYHLSLSNIAFNVYSDVEHFLQSQFSIIYQENPRLMANIPLPWPSPPDLDEIVRKVNGSFIFASTLMKYIREGKEPPERLKLVVESHDGVDGMYAEIIKAFWKDVRFPTVFSTIMLLHQPLSVSGLASLLQLSVSEILIETFKVQSILVIPADDSTPVEVVHTSLRDFSVSQKRSGELFVNSPQNHVLIAKHCLQVMSTQSVEVVFEGEAAGYASEHWHLHFLLTLGDPDCNSLQYGLLVGVLESFAVKFYKTWYNTLLDKDKDAGVSASLEDLILQAKKITLLPPQTIKTLKRIRDFTEVRDRIIRTVYFELMLDISR